MALLSNLETLVLEGNSFSGLIFGILMNFTELKILDLFGNFFHGTIPEDFGMKLTKLNKLILGLNKFTGPIPSSIGNCTELTHLVLGFSNFSGNVSDNLTPLLSHLF
jgi:Leucine-rich repeat (LRR) protein